ncbi:YdbC family protein [Peribacillus asahii]|uniref:YdbC family protein n=1 Tax=Peribacillus asahii TaxID=228899 RepID=UPI0038277724
MDIIQTNGILSQSAKGWKKELNLVSWNGKEPKYDLREWAPGHEKMGKGLTLTGEELKTLREILNGLEL